MQFVLLLSNLNGVYFYLYVIPNVCRHLFNIMANSPHEIYHGIYKTLDNVNQNILQNLPPPPLHLHPLYPHPNPPV